MPRSSSSDPERPSSWLFQRPPSNHSHRPSTTLPPLAYHFLRHRRRLHAPQYPTLIFLWTHDYQLRSVPPSKTRPPSTRIPQRHHATSDAHPLRHLVLHHRRDCAYLCIIVEDDDAVQVKCGIGWGDGHCVGGVGWAVVLEVLGEEEEVGCALWETAGSVSV